MTLTAASLLLSGPAHLIKANRLLVSLTNTEPLVFRLPAPITAREGAEDGGMHVQPKTSEEMRLKETKKKKRLRRIRQTEIGLRKTKGGFAAATTDS